MNASQGTGSVRRPLLAAVKFAILAGTLYWIILQSAEHWETFLNQKKHWGLLIVAFLLILGAHLISYWRWRILVENLGVPMSPTQSLRLGFLGTLFNQVSVGSVGGDFFKAVEATRTSHGKRTEVVGSILVDRALGLLGLLIVASCGLLASSESSPRLIAILWAAVSLSAIGLLGLSVIGLFGRTLPLSGLGKLPKVGETLLRLTNVCMVFYGRPGLIAQMILYSMGVHTCFTLGCFVISAALFSDYPGIIEHFATVPPAMAAATLPLTPGGVGVQEVAIAALFEELHELPDAYTPVIMAATFRLMLIAVCVIGAVYYTLG